MLPIDVHQDLSHVLVHTRLAELGVEYPLQDPDLVFLGNVILGVFAKVVFQQDECNDRVCDEVVRASADPFQNHTVRQTAVGRDRYVLSDTDHLPRAGALVPLPAVVAGLPAVHEKHIVKSHFQAQSQVLELAIE